MTRAEKMAAEISGTSGMRVAPEWLNQPRERIVSVRQQWLNDCDAEAGNPQRYSEFEPCSHCGGETIEECNFLCPIHDGRLSEACHGESA